MSDAALTAVILNWRTPDHTAQAARRLIGDGVSPARIVLVDNGSGDDSLHRLSEAVPGAAVVALERNIGFAAANNVGAAALPANVAYLFVNSDAFLHAAGSVERLVAALDDPRIGVAVPRLLNEDMTLQRTVAPLSKSLPEIVRASGLSRFVPNRLQPALGTYWDHSVSREIQAAIGPVMLIRADAWHQLGGFTERHFMYARNAKNSANGRT